MHPRSQSGIAIAVLGLLIALLHFLANMFFLYWAWWWFDIFMHFLGGLFVGLSILWLVAYEVPIGIRPFIPQFLTVVLGVFFVGLVWELFEYLTGLHTALNYTRDTVFDLAMDIVGALSAYVLFSRFTKHTTNTKQ